MPDAKGEESVIGDLIVVAKVVDVEAEEGVPVVCSSDSTVVGEVKVGVTGFGFEA